MECPPDISPTDEGVELDIDPIDPRFQGREGRSSELDTVLHQEAPSFITIFEENEVIRCP